MCVCVYVCVCIYNKYRICSLLLYTCIIDKEKVEEIEKVVSKIRCVCMCVCVCVYGVCMCVCVCVCVCVCPY